MASWFSATLETTIIINAPPEKVREVCLDFDRLAEWHTDFITSTTITRPNSDTQESVRGIEAKPGDSLAILAGGFVGLAKVQENSPSVFSYEYTGRKMGLDAKRAFYFEPEPSSSSSSSEGADSNSRTLFRHFASWQGYAATVFMAWSPIRLYVKGLFEGFHHDLKEVENKKRD